MNFRNRYQTWNFTELLPDRICLEVTWSSLHYEVVCIYDDRKSGEESSDREDVSSYWVKEVPIIPLSDVFEVTIRVSKEKDD